MIILDFFSYKYRHHSCLFIGLRKKNFRVINRISYLNRMPMHLFFFFLSLSSSFLYFPKNNETFQGLHPCYIVKISKHPTFLMFSRDSPLSSCLVSYLTPIRTGSKKKGRKKSIGLKIFYRLVAFALCWLWGSLVEYLPPFLLCLSVFT